MATENIEIRVRADGAREAGRRIANIGQQATRAARGVSGLGTAIGAAIGAAAVRSAARTADSYTLIQNRLRLISNDSQNLAGLTEAVFAQAQRTRSEYEAQASLVSRIARASRDLGASQGAVLQVSEAVAQSFAISGASVQETNAASIQLGQALASGTLRGDELRSILENNARLSQTIADGLGVGVGELRELGAAGKITSKAVFAAIQEDAERLKREFETLGPTFEQGLTQAQNALTQIAGDLELGETLGQLGVDFAQAIEDARIDIIEFVGTARGFTAFLFGDIEQFVIQIKLGLNTIEGVFASIEAGISGARTEGGLLDDVLRSASAASQQANQQIAELPQGLREAARLVASPYLVAVDAISALDEGTQSVESSTDNVKTLAEERLQLEQDLIDAGIRQEELAKKQTQELLDQVAAIRAAKAEAAKIEEDDSKIDLSVEFEDDEIDFAQDLIDDLNEGTTKAKELEIILRQALGLQERGLFTTFAENEEKASDLQRAIEEIQAELFSIQGGDEALDIFEGTRTEIENLQAEIIRTKELAAGGFFAGTGDDQGIETIRRLQEELRGLQGGDEAESFVERTRTEVEQLETDIARVKELAAGGFFGEGEDLIVLERLNEDLEEARNNADETFKAMEEFGKQAARNMQDALADFFFDPFQDGLDGALRSFIDTIRRMVSELLAQKALQALFSSFDGTGGVFGSIAGALAGNAMGGTVRAGDTRLVGERGPELVNFNRPGQVSTATETAGGMQQAAAPIVIVEQDPQAIVSAMGTAAGRSEIFKAVQADAAQFRQVLGVPS